MNFKQKIGYVPYSNDLQHPDDRRRFPYFARRKGIAFEIADHSKDYHIVILHASANLSLWLAYKQRHPRTKFLFEMVDSLIFQNDLLNRFFKGPGRYLLGKEAKPVVFYKKLLFNWLETADVVLCSNPQLCNEAFKFNPNVLLSLDYLQHEYQWIKRDYTISGKMKLLWEGQGEVLLQFLAFKEMLSGINEFCELHVVTSEKLPRLGPLFPVGVNKVLKDLPIQTHFHRWNIDTNARLFSQMDAAMIPLNRRNQYAWHKPANKLLSFWFSGLPVLCSDSPAYSVIANESATNILCSSTEEWVEKLHELKNLKADERYRMAEANFAFSSAKYGESSLDAIWYKALELLQS